MVGIFSLVAYLSQLNNDGIRIISVLDESDLFVDEFRNTEGLRFNILSGIRLPEAKKLSELSEDYGLLFIPKIDSIGALTKSVTFYSEDSPSLQQINDIEDAISEKANALRLEEAGIDAERIKRLRIRVSAKQETYKGEETSKLGSILKLAFGGAAGYLLFMFIIIYGNMIMRSVIEEKTSRIIEIIISSVKPIQLLLGKILGTSLAGITQFLAWVLLVGVFSIFITAIFGVDPASAQSPQQELINQNIDGGGQQIVHDLILEIGNLPIANLVIMFLFFFIGGYLLYASLYAAIGAAVDSETDTQQFMLPILMPLILAIYVGFFTVIENPHGTVSQVFSYIPFTSPVVMLMRIPFGVPIWQQLLSLVILFTTFFGTVWFAAKIYKVGILMYGKKASYTEILKWLKY
jgi:ABC-2 type transport system permease protein